MKNLGYDKNHCLDAFDKKEQNLTVYLCHETGGNQYFEYKDGFIKRDKYSIAFVENQLKFTTLKENGSQVCD